MNDEPKDLFKSARLAGEFCKQHNIDRSKPMWKMVTTAFQSGYNLADSEKLTLPSVDEAGAIAVRISEQLPTPLKASEQALFIAGFQTAIQYLENHDE